MSNEWQWDDTVARPTHRNGKPIRGTEHIRFITVGFAELLANLPDPETIASDPELAEYWPDDYDYRADYDGPLTDD